MEKTEWFDEISMAYGKNLREIETARERLDQQCASILGHLVEVVQVRARQDKLKVVEESGGTGRTGPWKNVWIQGEFAKAVSAKLGSSIACGFRHGDFWGDRTTDADFGFVAYLSFTLPKKACAAMNILEHAKDSCKGVTEVHWANGGFYLAYEQLSVGSEGFSIAGARNAMAALMASFVGVDVWMAKTYKDRVLAATE
jgi:hypothetical protein